MQSKRLGRVSLGLVASALMISPSLGAQDAKDATALITEYDGAYREWLDSYRAATKPERQQLISKRPLRNQWYPKLFNRIDAAPASEEALTAASWLVTRGQARGKDLNRAIAILLKHHIDSPKMAGVCSTLGRTPTIEAEHFLSALLKQSSHETVQGQACLNLAQLYKSQASLTRMLKTADEKRIQSLTSAYGRETIDVLKSADAKEFDKRAEQRYQQVMDTPAFAGIRNGRRKLGDTAKSNLFELRHLAIGEVAPEIAGEDLDGNPMQLSDYRGKVVVLDFWGDW